MIRLLDIPLESLSEVEASTRALILEDVTKGVGEDAIYRRHVDMAVNAARSFGHDESDVEVAASLARNTVANILAELRAAGVAPEG